MSLSFFVFKDGLNLTSSEERPQLLDNRTIQNIVMDYVEDYMGRYPVASYLVAIGGMQYWLIDWLIDWLNICVSFPSLTLKDLYIFYDYRNLLRWRHFSVFSLI